MNRLILVGFFALAGCSSTGEPRVVTRDVILPVHAPCTIPEPAKPDFADDDEDLRAAPDLFSRVRLLAAGRLQRMGYEAELVAWGRACAM